MPEKEESLKSSESNADFKAVPGKTSSILESDIFQADPEQERELYLRMFVDNYQPEGAQDQSLGPLSEIPVAGASYQNPFERQKSNDETFLFTKKTLIQASESTSSLNDRQDSDRPEVLTSQQSLKDRDFDLTLTRKSQNFKKSMKQVSFKE
jgi:hypothetical protein